MSTNERAVIIISSQCLKPGGVCCITKKLKSSSSAVLIKGKVLNPDNSPSIGACVEVVELAVKETTLGYVFTNDKGDFDFTINYKPNADYKLSVYSPLPGNIL